MSGHIADKAGFLAALAADDPERKLAEEHARSCASCAEALDEGARLVGLLAEAVPAAGPTPELLARAAAAIEKEGAMERRARSVLRWAAAGVVSLMWVGQLLYGKQIIHDTRSVVTSLALLAIAIVGVTYARASQRALIAALVAASGVFAWAVGAVAGLETRIGLECTACELVAAAIPWLLVTVLAWRQGVALDRGTVVAVAAAGALASQAGQIMGCPVPHANPHLLIFHLGGVLLAAALAFVTPIRTPAAISVER
jgi:hypothetical protein